MVLLDVRMPDMDGFETAELIRQRKRSKNTPIILITAADVSSDQIIRGYSAGAVDFIFKPFVHQLLEAKVRIFIELFRKSEKLRVSEQRFRLLVESVKDYAIFMLDTEGMEEILRDGELAKEFKLTLAQARGERSFGGDVHLVQILTQE